MGVVNPRNLRQVRAAYKKGLTTGKFLPAVFVIEPTNTCNVNCIMCPQSKIPKRALGEMSLSSARTLADAVKATAELVMLYFMGEPLLHSNLNEYLRIMRQSISGRLVISTNAVLLDEQTAVTLLDNQVDVLIVCVDRWDAKAYEAIRRGANFAEVVGNIENLLRLVRDTKPSPRVIVKALDIRMPAEERSRFERHWRERGATPLVGWIDTWAGQFPGLQRLSGRTAPYAARERVACADLWFKMVVNWRREVVLCCHDYNSSQMLGTIDVPADIDRVWQAAPVRLSREAHVKRAFDSNPLCRTCVEWAELDELDAYTTLRPSMLDLVF